MTNEQEAQSIYHKLLNEKPEELGNLLMELSFDNDNEPVMTIEDWIDDVKEYGDLYELIQVAQQSKDLDMNDDYVRTSIYYYGYATSDDVLNLVDKEEAIDWIASALKYNPERIMELMKP